MTASRSASCSCGLNYNSGVAFGLSGDLPAWLVLGGTGLVALLLVGYAWRAAPAISTVGRVGLAGILAGAIANIVDRAADGAVTDYLFTTWWPTFNLADTFITLGAALLVIATLREPPPPRPVS